MPLSWTQSTMESATGGRWTAVVRDAVRGFAIDARRLMPGEVFIALRGEQRDGHAYLGQARERGAAAAWVSQPQPDVDLPQLVVDNTFEALNRAAAWKRSRFSGTVIAITGSSGKTGTKDLLTLLLGTQSTHATKGNFNNHLGVPLTLLELPDEGVDYAVVEIGMNQKGEVAALTRMVQPHHAVVTSVGPAHLEGVGTVEDVAREKAEICRAAGPEVKCYFPENCLTYGVFSNLNAAVIVLRSAQPEPHPGRCLGDYKQLNYTTTIDPEAGLRLWWEGSSASGLFYPFCSISPGMQANAALAIAVAASLGVDDEGIRERLSQWGPQALRGALYDEGVRQWYVDCYNANPASMLDSFTGFDRHFRNQPRLFVLGGMRELGSATADWHRQVGAAIPARSEDRIVLVGAEAAWMRAGYRRAQGTALLVCVADTAEAVPHIEGFEGAVLLKGSRHYQLESLLPSRFRKEEEPC